ncbi:MAG: anaerobic ribonucleoside-triphosphate reductase activating protein, partial [Treponema sp.]|nr:anaerobic ribonucleoside-triphosphate reductase activating protein [Treponema sp.]
KNIRKSIALISEMPAQSREWRTVLVPPLASMEDIAQMATMLPKDAVWYLTTFQAQHCLNPSYQKIIPYSPQQEEELVKEAQKTIPGASHR